MKYLHLLSLISLVAANPIEISSTPSVELRIEKIGGTTVKATVKSNHNSDLKLLRLGSILDTVDVEKVNVFSGDNELDFKGVRLYIDLDNLPETAFINLPAGGSLDNTFEVAKFHDLSAGGDFKFDATGYLQYAEAGTTKITGTIPYEASIVTNVNGAEAVGKFSAFQEQQEAERAVVSRNTCKGNTLTAVKNALTLCNKNCKAAAKAARSGSSKRMKEYFKSDSSSTRKTVAGVFDALAKECSSSTSGQVSFGCGNTSLCKNNPGVVAYASGKSVVVCPVWMNQPINGKCHQGDRASVIFHEFSHSLKGTQDYNAYGYAALRKLPASKNIRHADTYTYFANAVEVNC